jgi:DnaJ-class molecular chaperone
MPPNRPCATCNGSGTVRVEITNTQTGQTQTITQTCLDCQFR